jgi:hypothetical protein
MKYIILIIKTLSSISNFLGLIFLSHSPLWPPHNYLPPSPTHPPQPPRLLRHSAHPPSVARPPLSLPWGGARGRRRRACPSLLAISSSTPSSPWPPMTTTATGTGTRRCCVDRIRCRRTSTPQVGSFLHRRVARGRGDWPRPPPCSSALSQRRSRGGHLRRRPSTSGCASGGRVVLHELRVDGGVELGPRWTGGGHGALSRRAAPLVPGAGRRTSQLALPGPPSLTAGLATPLARSTQLRSRTQAGRGETWAVRWLSPSSCCKAEQGRQGTPPDVSRAA